ncbi:zinc-binding dehydrogenase [Nocardioides sp. GXQ0305]|uniref:zinc-binding dehydrogenase n=1 Tax=Nocardioides sp. GXQ0305 TaxID=3423912 RepID=UPI003D7CE334
MTVPATTRQLRSLVTPEGQVRISLATVDTPQPRPHQVVVRVEAAPVNPSDLGLLLALADPGAAEVDDSPEGPVVTASVPEAAMPSMRARLDQSLPVGNEGAGTVVAAGDSPEAQDLLGKRVGFSGGGAYGEHALTTAQACLPLPDGATAADGAASFVNPLTALGMVETMRREGHTALVHTAAASNLGQMLARVCLADDIGLVNVVRRPEQADLLRDLGARHVVDSSAATFMTDLVEAIRATGATMAFDAVGGGRLASDILNAMEVAVTDPDAPYSRYGTDVPKQVYVYGSLDRRPIELRRGFGFSWGVGGWLLMPFLASLPVDDLVRLRSRIASELTTTFASSFTEEITLDQVLDLDVLRRAARTSTGEKFLIVP